MSIKDNLRAIALLKNLQSTGKNPNDDEVEILSKFNGWGALWQVFKPDHPEHSQLKSLLTPEEFTQANASILNAHYTDPEIVRTVWDLID